MKKYLESIRQFKLKSLFFRFYLLTFVFAILFIGIFSFYVYQIYFQNFSKAQETALDSFLTQTVEKLDNSVYFLNDTLISLSREPAIINSIIVPGLEHSARNFETAFLLKTEVESSDYISGLYLYESTDQILFTSQGAVGLLEDSPHEELVRYCQETANGFCLSQVKNRYYSGLTSYNGAVYLVCNLIADNNRFLGLLIAQINQDLLFADLTETIASLPYSLEIRTPNGQTPLFCGLKDLKPNSQSLVRTSSYTDWMYTLIVPPYEKFTLSAYLVSVFPALIFLLAIGLLCSLLIAQRSYQPIHLLLSSIAPQPRQELEKDQSTKKTAGSEIDLLTMTYQQLQSDQKAAEAFIRHARPDLEANLLLDLITGDPLSEQQLDPLITTIQSNLTLHGKYQSFLVHLSPSAETGDLVSYMVFRQLEELLKSTFHREWGYLYFLRPESDSLTFILQYDGSLSAAKVKQLQQQFLGELKKNLEHISAGLLLAYGKVYPNIGNITMSYHEAKEELRKQLYYEADRDAEVEGNGSEIRGSTLPGNSLQDSYFVSQLGLLNSFLSSNEAVLAESLLTQILKELCVSDSSILEIRQWCIRILDILVERTLDARTHTDNLGNPEYQTLYQKLDKLLDQKEIYLFMVKETSRFMENIKKELSKKQHRLIAQAKEYMQQHYSDSNLSIHQIAEFIGISGTYLSSIFTEFTGENLISYLNSYRVSIAKDLLINTQIIIKDIGFKTGFNTVQNFNRVFKKFTGMTPGDYRKQYKA